ncbi:quinon protein alcohol dehydrogenase-like superfamily [Baffinella frigidus]|nr:quinon protein alcohol dehydrogenase-like superfamily [Cryptophyta sp. CCMP2293]
MAATLLSLLFHTLFFFLSFLPAPIRRRGPAGAERLEPEPQSVLAVGTSDGHVLLLDAATGKIRLNVQSHDVHTNAAQRAGPRAAQRAGAACVALSPDGHLIATASWDGAWKLLDAGSGVERVRGQRHDGEGGCVCEMQGGGGEHGWGWAVDPACTVIGHSGIVRGIAFAPCGRLLATGGTDKSVILWGVETGRAQRRMLGHTQGVNAVAFTPDGQRLASCSDDGSVRVWERTRVNCVAFSHDGARLAAGGHDRLAKVWDAETWEILHIFGGHRGAVTSVALGLDGALASGGRDNAVLVHQAFTTPR